MFANKFSVLCALFGTLALLFCTISAAPVETNTLSSADIAALTNNTDFADILSGGDFTIINQTTSSNGTEKQLYVIKAVVYEVGILTEVNENSTESDESSEERVDLTFFNAHKNGSFFNFGDLPVPIQANITGHTYTEILPIHIGDGPMNLSDIASILPLPEHVLNFTQNDNTVFQYQSSPIHHHHHDLHENPQENHVVLGDEVQPEYNQLPATHHQHVSQDDLLKIPVIGNTIVIDYKSSEESSSSSSSEEDVPTVSENSSPIVHATAAALVEKCSN